ncbi:hypothetical protein [Thauera aromatica]|uniref:hypothetical protein n=1 Tax=Thauera aromatica TaxID=59405 RepID=UPI001FFD33D2|nr:hypothetical protein [Thauera aromatica]MCK2097716.1 hypothetical protein [Thauera aromatica]
MSAVTAMNPFQSAKVAPGNAVAESSAHREAQEVQAMMVIAKRFPRDQMQAMDRILQACTRPTLAEGALYSYGRGGADVTGPSIRLAEAIAQNWGNLQFGIRELSQSNGESTVEAFAWDIENNTRQVKVFQVPHIRYTRSGTKRLEDPRDIYELVANQGARRLRACILGVIPGDVVESAVKQCETTLTTSADTSPDAVKKMVDAFGQYGVTREQIEKRIQRRLDTITPALMVQMKKIYASLRDGMSAPGDWFDLAQSAAAAALPDYSDDELQKNIGLWASAMQSGKTTPERVIATVGSKYALSEAQKAEIRAAAQPATAPEVIDAPAAQADDDGWLQDYDNAETAQ